MKLHGELQSNKFIPVRRFPSGFRRIVRPSAWRFLAIVAICLLMAGCSTFGRSEPTASRWWGGSGPNPTASQKKDERNDKSLFASWFGSREREKPRTVNEWMAQTSCVHP